MDVDIKIDSTGDITFSGDSLEMVAGIELVTQRIIIGLRTFVGEWYADESEGTRWFQDVFTDQPKTNMVEAMLRKRILDDEDIESIASFSMVVDKSARTVAVYFTARSIYGTVSAETVMP